VSSSSTAIPLPRPQATHFLVTGPDGQPLAIADASSAADAVRAVVAKLGGFAANDVTAAPCAWVRRPTSLRYLGYDDVRKILGS
jgi:hypothetical protein